MTTYNVVATVRCASAQTQERSCQRAPLQLLAVPHARAIAVGAARDEFRSSRVRAIHYTFNTGTAQHYFCSHCGIYTHHLRRSNQNEYGVNVACLEGISPFDFEEVLVIDGINHPSDDKEQKGPRIAGTLHFVCNDG